MNRPAFLRTAATVGVLALSPEQLLSRAAQQGRGRVVALIPLVRMTLDDDMVIYTYANGSNNARSRFPGAVDPGDGLASCKKNKGFCVL